MVVLTLSKTLMPQKFSKKTSLAEKVKNIVWSVGVTNILMMVVIFNLILLAATCIQDIPLLSPSKQKFFLIISSIFIVILILTYLSMYVFCAKILQKVNRKCLNISIFAFLYIVLICIQWLAINLHSQPQGFGGILMTSLFCIGNFFVAFVFAKAAFIVSRVRDIWSLDLMTKKQLCPIPNMLLSTMVLFHVSTLAVMFLFGGSQYYD